MIMFENTSSKMPVLYKIAVIILMTFFYVSSYSISGFYRRTIFAMLSIIIAVALFLFQDKRLKSNWFKIVFFLMVSAVIIFRNHDISANDYCMELVFIAVLMLWLFPPKEDWYEYLLDIICCIGVVYTVTTLIFYFAPSLYRQYVYAVFPKNATYLLRNYRLGYMFGLAKNSAFNSAYILYALGVGICKLITKQNHFRYWDKAYLLIQIIALFLTVKRNAILFGFLSLIISYLIATNKKGKAVKVILVAGVLIFILAVISQFIPGISTALDKTIAQSNKGDISNGRFLRYEATWNVFKKSPLIGIGWGGLRESYVNDDLASTDSAHNVYLQLLAETGIIGFLVFILFFVYNLIRCIKIAKLTSQDSRYSLYGEFFLFIQLYFLMYCFSGNPLYDAVFFMMYLFSCIYVESMFYKEHK